MLWRCKGQARYYFLPSWGVGLKTEVVIWFGGKSGEEALNGEMGWCVGGGVDR